MPGLLAAPEFCNGDFTNPQHGKAPAQAPEYEYEPLPEGQYIRMLTLDPGEPDDLLQGKLEFVHINCKTNLGDLWIEEIVLIDSMKVGESPSIYRLFL
jgi:hypothetical protein